MLRITVELEPFGDASKASKLAQVCIGRVTKKGERLTYAVLVQEREPLGGDPIDRVFTYCPDEQDRHIPVVTFLADLMAELGLVIINDSYSYVVDEVHGAEAEYYREIMQNKRS